MEAKMSKKQKRKSEKRIEKKEKAQGKKKAERPRRYCSNHIQQDDGAAKQPEEVATTSSFCGICKEFLNFKGHCEKHCTKGFRVKLPVFRNKDCNKECCESTKLEKESKTLCSLKCGEDCCLGERHFKCCRMCDERIISGKSEEDLTKVVLPDSSQRKEGYDTVLEKMKAKFEEEERKSKQKNENTEVRSTTSKNVSNASQDATDVFTYNCWYERCSRTTNNTKKAPETSKDRNDDRKALSDVNVYKSWWSSKFPSKNEVNKDSQDGNFKEDSENSPSKGNPKSSTLSSETQEINDQDESFFKRVINNILLLFVTLICAITPESSEDSYFHRIMDIFYGLFQRGRVETESMPVREHPPAHLPNPEVTALISPAPRRRIRRRRQRFQLPEKKE